MNIKLSEIAFGVRLKKNSILLRPTEVKSPVIMLKH